MDKFISVPADILETMNNKGINYQDLTAKINEMMRKESKHHLTYSVDNIIRLIGVSGSLPVSTIDYIYKALGVKVEYL